VATVRAPEAEIFGKTLRKVRESREPKLTQEDLAHQAGLTTNYVSDLERGVKVPSLTTILQLSHALGCAPSDLLADFTDLTATKSLIRRPKPRRA
jgi:transcriptional regulator with XRE-family HTH domain